MNFLDPRLPERFWSQVAPCPMSGCWLWFGHVSWSGYGRVTFGSKAELSPDELERCNALMRAAMEIDP